MSDILNHYHCARDAYRSLPDDHTIVPILTENYDVYRLGSQGPDFFYYNILDNYPLTASVAKLIHTRLIDQFFYYGLKFAQEHPEYADQTLAYLAGFASHHALDTLTHPFIYYRSGKVLEDHPETEKIAPLHKLYEVLLDTAMTQYEYSRQAVFESPEKVFIVEDSTLDFLEKFYQYVLKKVYGVDISRKDIKNSLKTAARVIAATKDPFDRRKKFLRNLEQRFGVKHLISKVFYPMYTNEFHILNIGQREWKNPVSGEIHNESYPQLFHLAVDKTQDYMDHLVELINKEGLSIEDVSELFHNISYLSGTESEEEPSYQFFDDQFIRYLYDNY